MTTKHAYHDHTLSVEDRVRHLLAEMTIEEKVAQLWGIWINEIIETEQDERQFSPTKAAGRIPNGVGHISRVGGGALLPPVKSAHLANTVQRFLVAQTRLGIPAIVHEESCAGYLGREATTFPQAIGLAAMWEPDLVYQMADVIRQQMRAVGAHNSLAPVFDVSRDPRWGRIEETYGEDPFLISAIGAAYVSGLQSPDWKQGIAATAKHFLGHSASEAGMNWAPAHIPDRELREVFLTPFKAALESANIATFMNAYHEHDGVPVGSSRALMVDLLRGELGFDGVVASDYFTINMFVQYHKIAATKQDAAVLGLQAGIDVELPGVDCYGQPLLDALAAGQIDTALIDASVQRVLKLKFQLGLFENPYVDAGKAIEVYNTPDQLQLSRTLAQKSIVLLKNEGSLLPLNPALKSIAVIGPSADSVRLLQGDYHYPAHLEGNFDPDVSLGAPTPPEKARTFDWTDHFPKSTTVLAGIRAAVSPDTQIHYAQGCTTTGSDTSGFAAAVEAARNAGVAVVVVGDKSGLARGCTCGESHDSATLILPGVQQQLVEAVVASGTPTVVVLLTGRPYAIQWIADHVPAVFEAWLPAQEGGAAIADILFGAVNPGGKLPVSVPRHVGQVPLYYNHKPSGGRSHWQGTYEDMTTRPLFAFGHGLSYTRFEYSSLNISADQVTATDTLDIRVTVKNCGEVAGDEVVQLYLNDPIASVTRPVKELKGFKRVTLQPGEEKTVTFALDVRHLAFYDRDMRYAVEPGSISVMIGAASDDIRLNGSFTITGSPTPVDQIYFTPASVT
ncbi:MAG: glycoside hydrolase family 3 C-terminal domain-containing protein [Chloroflexi bacterium]|nr:glycoside hydrolase family 3 C-terminal domain-containing protein [Chloroflexota bacterium]